MSINVNPMLVLHRVSIERNQTFLMPPISFSLAKGQWVQIVGPNGCGKTSLLRAIAGLLPVVSGRIDCCLSRYYLGHNDGLLPGLTVLENILLDPVFQVVITSQVQMYLDDFGLNAHQHTLVQLLSRGQRQRLALVKCLLTEVQLLILDEPLTALDAASQQYFIEQLGMKQQRGCAVVMSSHQTHKLLSAVDRIEL